MPVAPRKQTTFSPLLFVAFAGMLLPQPFNAQTKPAPPVPAPKNVPVGPPAPQSKHYPILLLAFGNEPDWNLRIGLKGPERFDRIGYPPIPLEPAEVINEAAPDTWTYRAKDSATGALVAIHLSREACTDAANDTLTTTPPLGGKYSFKVSVEHSQIGTLKGCARVATELFPKINNQPDQEDDETKKKPPVPVSSVTKFKSPIAVAYFNPSGQVVFKRGRITRTVSAQRSSGLAVSHDGLKLLFTADDAPGPIRTLLEYEFEGSTKHELVRANVRNPLWSLDDKRIAFLKWDEGTWSLWIAPADNPQAASKVFSRGGLELQGWPDEHTFLVSDYQSLLWISDDGSIRQELPFQEIFGTAYHLARVDSFRLNPVNSDLLLVSFWYAPPSGEPPLDKHEGNSPSVLLYEIKSKRRVALTPPGTWAEKAVWSVDGLQIFYSQDEPGKIPVVYRVFWDGIGVQRYVSGTELVVGQ